jgi:hypothetical protein
LCIVVPRKLIVLFCSNSAVNFILGCMVLKSFMIDCIFVWLVSKIMRMSSTILTEVVDEFVFFRQEWDVYI